MGETKKQKQLITVPEANNRFKGLEFRRWDAFVADYFAEHPECEKDNTPPPASSKKRRKKK